MTKTVVLLPSPRTRLKGVDGGYVFPPSGLARLRGKRLASRQRSGNWNTPFC